MKRTELKRKTPMNRVSKKKLAQGSPRWNGAMWPSVKPRKRLRAKSKTNSNRHVSKPVSDAYRENNKSCELSKFIPGFVGQRDAVHLHHILHGQARRHDIVANLIALSREAHDWVHAHPVEGRILCLFVKKAKGELSFVELQRISGKRFPGWIETKRPLMSWVLPYWESVLAA